MSDAGEFFKRREATLAASQTPLDPGSVAVIDRTSRRLRRRDTGVKWAATVAAVGVLAVGSVVVVNNLSDQEPLVPVPSPSAFVSESPSPSPTPSELAPEIERALIDGFAPVPHLPAEEIPWDEVGPGWFTVSFFDQVRSTQAEIDSPVDIGQRSGGISLVAPDGTWYAARDLETLGVGEPLGWDGDAVYVTTRVTWGPESSWVDLDIYDLQSGQLLGSERSVPGGSVVGVRPGQSLLWAYAGDGLTNIGIGAASNDTSGCSDAGVGFWGWEADDMSFLYSPEQGGQLVCFGPAASDSNRTAVTLVNVSDGAQSRIINEFQYNIYRYTFAGWLDGNRFFFARKQAQSNGAEEMFIYDLRDNSITSVDLPMYADLDYSTRQGYFHQASQRHIVASTTTQGWEVALFDSVGNSVATVSGECSIAQNGHDLEVKVSGERMVVFCTNPGKLAMFDLATGASLGAWSVGNTHDIVIDGHRPE